MYKLLVRGEPVGAKQYVYIFKEDKLQEQIGVGIEDLKEIVCACIEKYGVTHIDLSGAYAYMRGIEFMLREACSTDYGEKPITFRYV